MYRSPAEREPLKPEGLPEWSRPLDVARARWRLRLPYARVLLPVLAGVLAMSPLPWGFRAAFLVLAVTVVMLVLDRLKLRRWARDFRRGQELFKQGRRDDARRVLEGLAARTRLSPHWHVMVLAQYAAVLATAREVDRALLLTDVIEASGWLELGAPALIGSYRVPFDRLRPWVGALLATRAVCHLQSGRRDEAETALARAASLRLPPALAVSLLLPRAVLAGLRGRDHEVADVLREIPADPPDYGRQLGVVRAFALERIGQPGAATTVPRLTSPASAYWLFAAWPELEEWATRNGLVGASAP